MQPSNKFCLFTQIYWSMGEAILEQYWKLFYSGFKEVSNNYYFSNMFSPYPLGKWHCNSLSVKHLRNLKILVSGACRTHPFHVFSVGIFAAAMQWHKSFNHKGPQTLMNSSILRCYGYFTAWPKHLQNCKNVVKNCKTPQNWGDWHKFGLLGNQSLPIFIFN